MAKRKPSKRQEPYLLQRGQSFYARTWVPEDLVDRFGKRELVKALGTRDPDRARRLLPRQRAEWQDLFEIARASLQNSPITSPVIEAARGLRADILLDRIDPETASDALGTFVDNYLHGRRIPVDPETGSPETDPETTEEIRHAFDLVTDVSAVRLSETLRDYIKEGSRRLRQQTLNTQQRRIEAFSEWLGGDWRVRAVTRAKAGQYVTQVIAAMPLAVSTQQDIISYLSSFFGWCETRGLTEVNPFHGLAKTVRETSRGTKAKQAGKRRPWSADELQKLITETEPTEDLWWMPVLALYTGMRSNEIAETVIADVHTTHIHIPEAKSESGVRDVPLHPVIQPLVAWLKKKAKDEYLIPDLLRGGEDKKRNHDFVKRFSRHLRKGLGIKAQGVVFHALRHTFVTAAEEGRIPENIINQIVGHQKATISLKGYSAGVKDLAEDIKKVKYKGIDGIVSRRLKKLLVLNIREPNT